MTGLMLLLWITAAAFRAKGVGRTGDTLAGCAARSATYGSWRALRGTVVPGAR